MMNLNTNTNTNTNSLVEVRNEMNNRSGKQPLIKHKMNKMNKMNKNTEEQNDEDEQNEQNEQNEENEQNEQFEQFEQFEENEQFEQNEEDKKRQELEEVEEVELPNETKRKLKHALVEISRLDSEIQDYHNAIKTLRQQRQLLSSESIKLMRQYDLPNADVDDVNQRFFLRRRVQKSNPLSRKTLPNSLSQYFITNDELDEEDALYKSNQILEWIEANLCKRRMRYNLAKSNLQ